MINNATIQNYQSHKKTSLEFDKGVNVFVGPSDNGKSSILRALDWSINNKPSGDSFRSKWGGDTIVNLGIGNCSIKRIKSKKENKYSVESDSGTEMDFKAMGQDVPEDVKSILNMNDINIQKQMDSPFLLSASAGETARYLNKIVQLDKIDHTLSNIESRKRKSKNDLDYKEKELIKQEKELSDFDWLIEAEKKVKNLEKLNSYFIEIKNKYSDLDGIIDNIEGIKKEQTEYEEVLKYEEQVNSLIELNKEIQASVAEKNNISKLLTDIKETQISITESNKIVKYEPKVDEMILLFKEYTELKQNKTNLSQLVKSVKISEEEMEVIEFKLKDAEEEYTRLFPDICPLCEK